MPKGVFLGFDFGTKRIGVAIGQRLTNSASPLATLSAKQGVPDWQLVAKLLKEWEPEAFVVGIPTAIDGSELYTTVAARRFAKQLQQRFGLEVFQVDERLTTKEARSHLFEQGGYRKMQETEIDGIAACIILEQWLNYPHEGL